MRPTGLLVGGLIGFLLRLSVPFMYRQPIAASATTSKRLGDERSCDCMKR
jgi:hypothetical protein